MRNVRELTALDLIDDLTKIANDVGKTQTLWDDQCDAITVITGELAERLNGAYPGLRTIADVLDESDDLTGDLSEALPDFQHSLSSLYGEDE